MSRSVPPAGACLAGGARRLTGAGTALALVVLAAPRPGPAWAGAPPGEQRAPVRYAAVAAEPPALPQGGEGCVGASPVVSDAAPWAVRRVAPQAVWPLTRGAGVLVAVVDTGVSATAGALAGAVRRGADVAGPGTGDRDCAGRGTALAGIVAARPMAGSGFVGVAPAATVFPVRIVDGRGKVGTNAIARGIRKATEAGADVILVGTGTAHPDDTLRSAVRAAVERDVVVVASVSDDEPVGVAQRPAPWYPAADEDVLAVGGVGTDGAPTEASPAEAGVDLLAPAAGAVSIGPSGTGHYTVGGPAVAAAHVAGAAVLVRAYHPQLTQAEVRRRLELTAEHPRGGGPAPGVGYGTLDLYEAVAALQLGEEPLPGTPPPMTIMAEPPRPDPAVAASVFVAVATVTAAAFGYVSARVIHWGRRRRWRS